MSIEIAFHNNTGIVQQAGGATSSIRVFVVCTEILLQYLRLPSLVVAGDSGGPRFDIEVGLWGDRTTSLRLNEGWRENHRLVYSPEASHRSMGECPFLRLIFLAHQNMSRNMVWKGKNMGVGYDWGTMYNSRHNAGRSRGAWESLDWPGIWCDGTSSGMTSSVEVS